MPCVGARVSTVVVHGGTVFEHACTVLVPAEEYWQRVVGRTRTGRMALMLRRGLSCGTRIRLAQY
eukprot:2971018-Rhodomonas_salina.1